MQTIRLTSIIAASSMIVGCATANYSLVPNPNSLQKIVYADGVPMLLSTKQSIVALYPAERTFSAASGPKIAVRVTNKTTQPFEFSTEDISASLRGRNLHVRTYDELVAEQQEKIKSANQSAMFAAILGGISAAGGQSSYASANTQALAASNVQNARTTMSNSMDQVNQANAEISELTKAVLKKQTVYPGKSYGGYVQLESFESPPDSPIEITVNFAGERHEFGYRLSNK